MKTKSKKVAKKATKKQSDRLILSFKGYEVNLGPGEATDLIDMMSENWPAKYTENADIARLKELDSRGKLEKAKNAKFKSKVKINPKKSEEKSKAYQKGFDSYFYHENPYKHGTKEYRDYREGVADVQKIK